MGMFARSSGANCVQLSIRSPGDENVLTFVMATLPRANRCKSMWLGIILDLALVIYGLLCYMAVEVLLWRCSSRSE